MKAILGKLDMAFLDKKSCGRYTTPSDSLKEIQDGHDNIGHTINQGILYKR